MTKGRTPRSLTRNGTGPAIGFDSLGIGLTVGRPDLHPRQSRFESGLPKNPNKRGRSCANSDGP